MRLGLGHEFAGLYNFVVGEQAGFEDHFYDAIISSFHHIADFSHDAIQLAVLEPTDIHHHVNFVGAGIDGCFGFITLGIRIHGAQRETYHRTNLHVAVFQQGIRQLHTAAVDANTGELMLGCLSAQLLDLRLCCLRLEQGVVDVAGQFRHGVSSATDRPPEFFPPATLPR